MSPSYLEFRGISKHFGGVTALSDVHLEIERGAIHGVIGENGAGKSTLMKILYGIYQPEKGTLLVNGVACRFSKSADAIARGIGMVHQHFMLAGPLSALDNIIVGAEPTRGWRIDRQNAEVKLREIMALYGLPVELHCPVEELPVGIQQRIEILKLLFRDSEIIILDEPTAVLTPQETQIFFTQLAQLKQQGKTVILITHKLREVLAITDRITVLRTGKVVGEVVTAETDAPSLARMMVGRNISLHQPLAPAKLDPAVVLEVANLCLANPAMTIPKLSNVSFSIRKGEIIGVAGVEGNGQSELLQCLLHPASFSRHLTGSIKLLGQDLSHQSDRQIRDAGVAVIPEDRLAQGLLPEQSLEENFLLGLQRRDEFLTGGFFRRERIQKAALEEFIRYDVRPAALDARAKNLSGGNQQKLIAAREFYRKPRLVIAAHPTRGVDISAIELIHAQLIAARDAGAGVLLVSSELDEILALSDRILVMYEGRITATFDKGTATEKELGLKMGGL